MSSGVGNAIEESGRVQRFQLAKFILLKPRVDQHGLLIGTLLPETKGGGQPTLVVVTSGAGAQGVQGQDSPHSLR